jgi:hypothetical protein
MIGKVRLSSVAIVLIAAFLALTVLVELSESRGLQAAKKVAHLKHKRQQIPLSKYYKEKKSHFDIKHKREQEEEVVEEPAIVEENAGEEEPCDGFQCPSGRCIRSDWVCDRDNDCGDESDEANCHVDECPEGWFMCADQKYCVNEGAMCDGYWRCRDGSDESFELCGACPSRFDCGDNSTCVATTDQCNGVRDCPGGQDEEDCQVVTCGGEDEFACANTFRCLPFQSWRCDGDNDCGDNSDEENCDELTCNGNYFKCESLNRCLPNYFLCDGDFDCPGKEDEKNCGSGTCEKNEFQCEFSLKCIPENSRCDGFNQCADFSDERDCGEDSVELIPAIPFDDSNEEVNVPSDSSDEN